MRRQYVIRFEGADLVCFLIVDDTNFVEIGRELHACCNVDDCAAQIDRLMQLAEMEHGDVLPWTFTQDPTSERLAWTGPLNPVRI